MAWVHTSWVEDTIARAQEDTRWAVFLNSPGESEAPGVARGLRCKLLATVGEEIGHGMQQAVRESCRWRFDQLMNTAAREAARKNNLDAIHALVEAGMDVNTGWGRRQQDGLDENMVTLLHLASLGGSIEAASALLAYGASVNALDENEATPLHYAAASAGEQGAAEVVDLLLRSGADETRADLDRRTPLDDLTEEDGEESDSSFSVFAFDDHQAVEGPSAGRDPELIDSVRWLLANAPADRAWRRRGYLVLCRAFSNRVLYQDRESGGARAGGAHGAKLAGTEAKGCKGNERVGGVCGMVDGAGSSTSVEAKVLDLQEEGIFRAIVGYL